MENVGFIAILLSILLWAMFVLLPMWPAIKIYKLFPDTKVGISGPLQGLDVKASGAFAAYVVTALLGFILVLNTKELIDAYKDKDQSWSVISEIQFLDAEGNPLDDANLQSLLKVLDITILPDKKNLPDKQVKITIPNYNEDIVLQYSLDGYITKSKTLSDATPNGDNKLDLGHIELKPVEQEYRLGTMFLAPSNAVSRPANEEVASSQDEQEAMLASQQ